MYQIKRNGIDEGYVHSTFSDALDSVLETIRSEEIELGARVRLENESIIVSHNLYETEYKIEEY